MNLQIFLPGMDCIRLERKNSYKKTGFCYITGFCTWRGNSCFRVEHCMDICNCTNFRIGKDYDQ